VHGVWPREFQSKRYADGTFVHLNAIMTCRETIEFGRRKKRGTGRRENVEWMAKQKNT
jgi:hypothetical protein